MKKTSAETTLELDDLESNRRFQVKPDERANNDPFRDSEPLLPSHEFNRGDLTRKSCLNGLCAAFFLGFACVISSIPVLSAEIAGSNI